MSHSHTHKASPDNKQDQPASQVWISLPARCYRRQLGLPETGTVTTEQYANACKKMALFVIKRDLDFSSQLHSSFTYRYKLESSAVAASLGHRINVCISSDFSGMKVDLGTRQVSFTRVPNENDILCAAGNIDEGYQVREAFNRSNLIEQYKQELKSSLSTHAVLRDVIQPKKVAEIAWQYLSPSYDEKETQEKAAQIHHQSGHQLNLHQLVGQLLVTPNLSKETYNTLFSIVRETSKELKLNAIERVKKTFDNLIEGAQSGMLPDLAPSNVVAALTMFRSTLESDKKTAATPGQGSTQSKRR